MPLPRPIWLLLSASLVACSSDIANTSSTSASDVSPTSTDMADTTLVPTSTSVTGTLVDTSVTQTTELSVTTLPPPVEPGVGSYLLLGREVYPIIDVGCDTLIAGAVRPGEVAGEVIELRAQIQSDEIEKLLVEVSYGPAPSVGGPDVRRVKLTAYYYARSTLDPSLPKVFFSADPYDDAGNPIPGGAPPVTGPKVRLRGQGTSDLYLSLQHLVDAVARIVPGYDGGPLPDGVSPDIVAQATALQLELYDTEWNVPFSLSADCDNIDVGIPLD